MSLWVYAVVPGGARVRGTGLAGERLQVIPAGGIAAVVGEQARTPAATPSRLMAYDRILQRLAARLTTIVPARFGTRVADEAELQLVLRARRQSLHDALAHVRGRVQMTVRVAAAVPPRTTAGRIRRRAERAASNGTTYLRSRAAAAASARDVPEFAPLRAAVSRWVRDERIERRGRLVTVCHLIPRASAAAYGRALVHAAHVRGVQVALSGPWLPYAFVSPDGFSG